MTTPVAGSLTCNEVRDMAENSKIEWTDHTFNPWIGCLKVSQGCKNCYAETLMTRYGRDVWGPTARRERTKEANWRKPLKWNKQMWVECAECAFRWPFINPTHHFCPRCECEDLYATRQRVFCASLADVFEDRPELVEWRHDLFRLIEQTPALDWLLLTKRPENVNQMVADYAGDCEWIGWDGVVKRNNIWIGTSVEDQATAEERIPRLLDNSAHIHFLSVEPQIGPVDLSQWLPGIDWVIVGGESGKGARPFNVNWVYSIMADCYEAGVPVFVKQLGARPFETFGNLSEWPQDTNHLKDKKGGDWSEWPEEIKVRQFPETWRDVESDDVPSGG